MKNSKVFRSASAAVGSAIMLAASYGWAAPKTVDLYAKLVFVDPASANVASTPFPQSIPMWGFSTAPNGLARIPGPQIDVAADQQPDGLIIRVHNLLTNLAAAEPVSVVIPGLGGNADVGQPVRFSAEHPNYANRIRSLVPDIAPGSSRTYSWSGPLKPGTYGYHSGTHPALQVQMGLYGVVTVRSNAYVYPGYAIPTNRETVVIFSEIDPALHWAVHTNAYGPEKSISSTIHSDPSRFLINGRTYGTTAPNLVNPGLAGSQSLFRIVNFCWDSRIPTLVGPVPAGNISIPTAHGHYLTAIAEDGSLYPYPKVAYAHNVAAMKAMDFVFQAPAASSAQTYILYDHRLGLSNPSEQDGGMYAKWTIAR